MSIAQRKKLISRRASLALFDPANWITLDEARKLLNGGKGITAKSMMNRVYAGTLPDGCWRKSMRGNYFFHKPSLMGLTTIQHE
ncbi:hypothetical protein [Deminuibacter soli]|uniref:DNA-binding protein n=1 Tax=Deminuibacter soli TaxID=2291815 RepID=A0A3E1NQ60_9BACT|nr:hypothetical protein [Deminuibacter soli]RFM30066.1 hypothetical protein DXN05_03580 [Deminuibacter soli]